MHVSKMLLYTFQMNFHLSNSIFTKVFSEKKIFTGTMSFSVLNFKVFFFFYLHGYCNAKYTNVQQRSNHYFVWKHSVHYTDSVLARREKANTVSRFDTLMA